MEIWPEVCMVIGRKWPFVFEFAISIHHLQAVFVFAVFLYITSTCKCNRYIRINPSTCISDQSKPAYKLQRLVNPVREVWDEFGIQTTAVSKWSLEKCRVSTTTYFTIYGSTYHLWCDILPLFFNRVSNLISSCIYNLHDFFHIALEIENAALHSCEDFFVLSSQ